MKKMMLIFMALFFVITNNAMANSIFKIDELDINISMPSDYTVLTKDLAGSSESLKTLKIDTHFMSKFIERAEVIKRNEKKRTEEVEEQISLLLKNEVDKVVNSISDQGMGINSLDIDEILSNIVKNRKLNNGISR